MREAIQRIQIAAKQLSITDKLLDSTDTEYHLMREKLTTVPSYAQFLDTLYQGQRDRQMVLGDLFEYVVTGRGYFLATQGQDAFHDYIRIILYLVNLLLIQESVFSFRTQERQSVLRALKAAKIQGFFASPEEESVFQQLQRHKGRIAVTGETRQLYKVMDSLTPKPLGAAIELIVYVHLLNLRVGYVVPLLLSQRLFNGMSSIAPPDYLVLLNSKQPVGVEVGGGMGQYSLQQGKIDQINQFIQETGIPVITAGVPHIYRCETCQCWIPFCDETIEQTATGECKEELVNCVECARFDKGKCTNVIYYGQTETKGQRRRHHYYHYAKQAYVRNTSLRNDDAKTSKLVCYFPFVKGFENLPRRSQKRG